MKKHTIEYYDHLSSMAEPPYDDGDFSWQIYCDECDEVLAEGDGYDAPKNINDFMRQLEAEHTAVIREPNKR